MKKIAILFLTLMVSLCANSQTFKQWSADELEKANTAKNTNLTEQEKLVYFYCNLARLDGEKFMQTYAKDHLKGNSTYVASLKRDLKNVKNRPMLYPEASLCKTSAFHADDMGKTGKIGHASTDGTGCTQRIRKSYSGSTIGENCSYGYSAALDIVMQLLIDEGIPDCGHRENILDSEFTAMGVSIKQHKVYRFNCVMDFGDNVETPMK